MMTSRSSSLRKYNSDNICLNISMLIAISQIVDNESQQNYFGKLISQSDAKLLYVKSSI